MNNEKPASGLLYLTTSQPFPFPPFEKQMEGRGRKVQGRAKVTTSQKLSTRTSLLH